MGINMVKERIILGIDPGTIVMGYGIIRIIGNRPMIETMGVLQLSKYEDHYLRLRRIFERVLSLIDQYSPDELAIESPFFGKNVQSMLKLGRAQGVAMAAALEQSLTHWVMSLSWLRFGARVRNSTSARSGTILEAMPPALIILWILASWMIC